MIKLEFDIGDEVVWEESGWLVPELQRGTVVGIKSNLHIKIKTRYESSTEIIITLPYFILEKIHPPDTSLSDWLGS